MEGERGPVGGTQLLRRWLHSPNDILFIFIGKCQRGVSSFPLFDSMNKAQKDIWEIEFVLGIVLVCQMEIDSASFRLPFILEQPLNLWLFLGE